MITSDNKHTIVYTLLLYAKDMYCYINLYCILSFVLFPNKLILSLYKLVLFTETHACKTL